MRAITPISMILAFLITGCWPKNDSYEQSSESSLWSGLWPRADQTLRLHAHEFNGAISEPVLTWDMQPGHSHHVALSRDPSCKDLAWEADAVSSPLLLKDVIDGLYYGCVWACKNQHSECSAADNQGVKLVIDRSAPELDGDIQDIRTNKPFSLNLWVRDLSYVTFYWEVLDGPGSAIISDQVASKPVIYMTEPGTYTMQLTLTDDFMNQKAMRFKVDWRGSHKHASR